MHQGGAVLCPLEDARFEFVGQQFDYGSVAILRSQMHGRSILMVGDRGGRSDPVEILHQGLVTFGTCNMQCGLSIALRQICSTNVNNFYVYNNFIYI